MRSSNFSIGSILTNLGIEALNPMQETMLAAENDVPNILLLSDTGTGKTIAFLLKVLHVLDPEKKAVTRALIVAPSRELVMQLEKVFKTMGTGYKVTSCYGGHKRETEENNLLEAPALVIGTPGRLGDHIRRGNILVDNIQLLVLDEFDKSIEAGFQEEMRFILESLKNVTEKILTSATEGSEIPSFVALDNPLRLDYLTTEHKESLAIEWLASPEKDKTDTLFRYICLIGNRSAIVFCNHRDAVERTSNILKAKGITNEFYHGALEQHERDSALNKFRNGTVNVLVTTDLAARGLDIPNIRYIIHFHLPATEEIYTHRNGRTARVEATGTAVLIVGPDEKLPAYISPDKEITLPETYTIPKKPVWSTLYISAGKKDKVNKTDIVGFLSKQGHLKKEDVGLIEVKDFYAFAAVRKSKVGEVLQLIKAEKLKNKKVKIDIAK